MLIEMRGGSKVTEAGGAVASTKSLTRCPTGYPNEVYHATSLRQFHAIMGLITGAAMKKGDNARVFGQF